MPATLKPYLLTCAMLITCTMGLKAIDPIDPIVMQDGASTGNSKFRILLLPFGSKSHVNEQLVLGEELQARGHDIYLALTDATPPHLQENFIKKGHNVINFHTHEGHTSLMTPEVEETVGGDVFRGNWDKSSQSARLYFDALHAECQDMMADRAFLDRVKDIGLDMVIADGFPLVPCKYILPYHLKVPYVSFSGGLNPWFARIPTLPSVSPLIFVNMANDMTFLQRAINLLAYILTSTEMILPDSDTRILKQYCPEVSAWSELMLRSELFILTMDHHLEWPSPTMPNSLLIPGITLGPAKPLPPELQARADAAHNGVVVFSFGSMGGFMPVNLTLTMLEAFAQLQQTVFMRLASVPDDVKRKIPPNVHVMSWMPQSDLLAHPNTRVFITHCGNNGQYEALYHGVPMLGIPLFADQFHNAFRIEHHGLGLAIDLVTLTSSKVRDTVQELIHNTTYKDNVRRRSAILRDRPWLPKEEAAFWIDHVTKYGGEHLRSSGANLSLAQFFMLDVLAFFGGLIAVMIYVMYKLVKYIYRKCTNTSKDDVTSRQKEKTL